MILLGVIAWAGLRGDDGQGQAAAPPATSPSSSAPAPPPAVPPSSPPPSLPTAEEAPSSTPSSPSPVRVRWRGQIVINGSSDQADLDSVPPRKGAGAGADLVGDWLKTSLRASGAGVQLAVLGDVATTGRAGCQETLATQGTGEIEYVRTGDTVCVTTSQGRVARLQVISAMQTSTAPIIRATVTVWDPPQAPQDN